MLKKPAVWLAILALLTALFTALSPLEKTMGVNARIVYLHGAWVWAALAAILASGACGLAALLLRGQRLHAWSRALGRAGLLLWIAFLPMSLYVMQANWNGLFLDEPRFRLPLNFAIVGLLLQTGLALFPRRAYASAANALYAAALVIGMRTMENVMHPISPVFQSESIRIQIFFLGLLALLGLLAWQLARWFYQLEAPAAPRARPAQQVGA